MGSISLLAWRKAYMLEFLDGGVVKECFTFSLPPESEDFDFPQRITETKTFGGSVFDDYGNDTYKITLSGSTVNEDKKFIYRGLTKIPRYLTGTKEIFELQKIIKNWSDGKVTKGFFRKTQDTVGSDRKVYLYDLSKMSLLQIAAGTASRNYWRVFIKDLKIKRDKSKPFTYNYTLEMVGVEDDRPKRGGFLGAFADAVDAIQDVMDDISTVMEATEAVASSMNQIAKGCSEVKEKFEQMDAAAKNAGGSYIALAVGGSLDAVSRLMGGDSNSVYNSTKELMAAVNTFIGLCRGENDESRKNGMTESNSKLNVRFDSNDGSPVQTQVVEYCKMAVRPADPVKDDYIFRDWYSDETCETLYDFSKEVTESITLYAGWTLTVATVTFRSLNGSPVQPQKVPVGGKAVVPTPPTKEGFSFDAWCTEYGGINVFDFENTVITDNLILYARWTDAVVVTFESNGGSDVESQSLKLGEKAVYPLTPTKENFTFSCWCTDMELLQPYDFSLPVNSNITLYAAYVQIANTVTFEPNNGDPVTSQVVKLGGRAVKPEDPVKTGFTFVYWCDDKACSNEFRFTTVVTKNMTLYARWEVAIFNVTFNTDGGSSVKTQKVKYGDLAIFPVIPTKEGVVFEKWCTREEVQVPTGDISEDNQPVMRTEYKYTEFDFSTEIKAPVDLYAIWFGGK